MKLGPPPTEVAVTRTLDVLAPKFATAVRLVLSDLTARGLPARVAETLRTNERQTFLYGFGRTYDDGRGIVTNAATNVKTWHGYGLAVDIVHQYLGWDAPEVFWTALRDVAEAHGLVSGSRWQMKDRPHVQWAPMRVSPSERAVTLRDTAGLSSVWREVGAA